MNQSSKVSPTFSSVQSLGKLVIVVLAISAALDLAAIAVGYYQLTTPLEDRKWEIVRVLQLFAILTAWTFFLIWFYFAHRNLRALGIRQVRYSYALAIPSSIMLILVIKETDERQEEKHRRLTLEMVPPKPTEFSPAFELTS